MTHAYSLDFRQWVTKAVAESKSCREAVAQFEVSAATAVGFRQRLRACVSTQLAPILKRNDVEARTTSKSTTTVNRRAKLTP